MFRAQASKRMLNKQGSNLRLTSGKEVLNKYPASTIESELALILTVSALLVAFAGLIVDSVDPESFAWYDDKCSTALASNDTDVKDEAYWCDASSKHLALISWVAMLGSGMAYLASIMLYMSWRSARPPVEADDDANEFFHSISSKLVVIYATLVVAMFTIAGAQFMLQLFKFPFKYHRSILYVSFVVVIVLVMFLAWTIYDYKKLTSETGTLGVEQSRIRAITRANSAETLGGSSTSVTSRGTKTPGSNKYLPGLDSEDAKHVANPAYKAASDE
eukprot:m.54977 g.54977  ORF g.54977 m.54977 type:complete len:275 (-) comp22001_c0_seq1:104-928(-)